MSYCLVLSVFYWLHENLDILVFVVVILMWLIFGIHLYLEGVQSQYTEQPRDYQSCQLLEELSELTQDDVWVCNRR